MTDQELREIQILAEARGLKDLLYDLNSEQRQPISEEEAEQELLKELGVK